MSKKWVVPKTKLQLPINHNSFIFNELHDYRLFKYAVLSLLFVNNAEKD